ncbi:MAG: hypothetical protein HN742_13815 [Lentisphaerae bacterium]|jgi:endonuclease/exonuclease/phosphatase family metal-dependent hydrolase|nr:hypothetical protein [Lentisphaerota bacterium]MBT4817385.1 hypothetical protein [Lentisphaerota bacterium]MBT5606155.1 hypothetical protein [Lentisphaerota bacterium]MBT7056374.1 hypothetical protein [Lentisphaerota bacterium]MBT7842950.1 hypothetical protein [Lentisphaerota bacterium]
MANVRKRIMLSSLAVLVAIAVCVAVLVVVFPRCTRAPVQVALPVTCVDGTEALQAHGELTVMTINLAHGRKVARSQGFQSKATIRSNLQDIASVIDRGGAHVVAVQEADSRSWWNGTFDHAAYVAREAAFPYAVVGDHVSGWGLHYGTGLLSRLELQDPVAHTFHRSRPCFSKGFTVATVTISPMQQVDVVAVHLDFSSHRMRVSEIEEMADALEERLTGRPVIVMGDFNSEWIRRRSVVREFAGRLGLSTWEPESETVVTFPDFGARLDYILISDELEFVSHAVLEDVVSDHLAVVATVRLRSKAAPGMGTVRKMVAPPNTDG